MSSVFSIDPRLPEVKRSVLSLLNSAFGSFPEGFYEHILTNSPKGSVLYAVSEGSDIVAMNAFIAHSVHREGAVRLAYQSCLSATRNDQKGLGHFSRLINYAKEDLKDRGGAFIFGFPNHNSGPIFVGKLGFTVSDNVPCIVASVPFFTLGRLNQDILIDDLTNEDRIYFDIYEVADWKRRKDGSSFVEYESFTNYIFGRVVERRKYGFRSKVLVVAGYEINKPYLFNALLEKAMRSSGASMARINANSSGPLAAACKFKRDASLTEPTIAFGLNWDVDAKNVEACSGVKDVY